MSPEEAKAIWDRMTNFERTVVSMYEIGEYASEAEPTDDDDEIFLNWMETQHDYPDYLLEYRGVGKAPNQVMNGVEQRAHDRGIE